MSYYYITEGFRDAAARSLSALKEGFVSAIKNAHHELKEETRLIKLVEDIAKSHHLTKTFSAGDYRYLIDTFRDMQEKAKNDGKPQLAHTLIGNHAYFAEKYENKLMGEADVQATDRDQFESKYPEISAILQNINRAFSKPPIGADAQFTPYPI